MSEQQKTNPLIRTLNDIQSFKQIDGVEPIPKLAMINRKTTGWIRILIFGLLRLAWASFLFCFVALTLFLWLGFSVEILSHYIGLLFPDRVTISLIIMMLLSFWIIYKSEGWRSILEKDDYWSQPYIEAQLLQLLMKVYARIVQLMTAIVIATFLLYSLFPFALVALLTFERLRLMVRNLNGSGLSFALLWQPVLTILLFALLIYSLRKNRQGRQARLLIIILGTYGLYILFQSRLNYDIETYVLAALIVAYPIGLVFFVCRLFTRPYPAFYKALLWIYLKIRARWNVRQALNHHHHRNQKCIQGDGWATVCKEHSLRFISATEHLAYLGRFTYYFCPTCLKDTNAYNGVECMAMKLDVGMNDQAIQAGPTLYLNGLQWINHNKEQERPVFDTLVIGKTKKLDIDEFIAIYSNKTLGKYSRKLKHITGQVLSGNNLEANERHLLEEQLAELTFGFDPQVTPNACSRNIRLRDTISRGNFKLQTLTKRTVRLMIILAILAFILISCYLFLIPNLG